MTSSTANWPADCSDYWRLANVTERCQFVTASPACDSEGGLVQYLAVFVCQVPDSAKPAYLAACTLWLVFLFVALATTADSFFCPSLTVMSRNLRLSHNLAGVTLLAFGNGAPDIFSSLAAVSQSTDGDASLAFGALLGAGIFVTTVVSGAVSVARPFKAMERPLLKDLVFYLAALFLTFFVLYRGSISLAESSTFLGLYVVFVAVTLVARLFRQWRRRGRPPAASAPLLRGPGGAAVAASRSPGENAPLLQTYFPDELIIPGPGGGGVTDSSGHGGLFSSVRYAISHRSLYDELDDTEVEDSGGGENAGGGAHPALLAGRSLQSVDLASPASGSHEPPGPAPAGTVGCSDFLRRISPIDVDAWKSDGWLARLAQVVKAPCLLPLILTVPVVDDEAPLRGWCRQLNCFHVVSAPMICLMATGLYSLQVRPGIPLVYIVLPVALLLASAAACLTNSRRPPVWHDCLAWLGFLAAVLVIYLVANEVVALLQAFGVLLDVSDAVLGLTFLAWGNSIGDMISNVTLSRRGYPRMAISACFGGPMFNLLVGVGLSFTVLLVKQRLGEMRLIGGRHDFLLLGTLGASLCFTLIYSVASGFRFGRPYAGVLFGLYAAFLTTALLVEFHVIRVFD